MKTIIRAEIVSRKVMPGVLSASGMVPDGDAFWVIGDDSPWIYRVGRDGNVLDRRPWSNAPDADTIRIPKPVKPDFEMMEWIPGTRQLLVMGSGSVIETRSRVLIWDTESDTAVLDQAFPELYEFWAKGAEIGVEKLNLEGMAMVGEDIILLNRSPKLLFKMNFAKLQLFWMGAGDIPGVTVIELDWRDTDAAGLGFSGASACPLPNTVFFCLSTEDTPNSYDDGAVGQCYLGLFTLVAGIEESFRYTAITEKGNPVNLKVESIAMGRMVEENIWQVFAVTDSDGGDSELLELRVMLYNPI